ncbi:MAG TPA: protein kinase, partial [Thermoanaerobaculia bacterium]
MTTIEPRICAECGLPLPEGAHSCPQCSTAILKHDFPPISGYKILELLAEGGMGAIYLAEDLSLERRVAIKVISKKIAGDVESRTRFAREARSLATVEHPNVVHVYAYGEVDGQAYLVMEFVEGETLGDLIRREEQLPIDNALRIVRQTVEALDAAWEKKIVHRDIKPSNILIDRRGHVRVADFGLAKPLLLATDHSLTHSGYLLGTPHYISPEQAQGKPVDFRSDIYSLGMMLYEMLTGERAFQGTTTVAIVAKHLNDPLPSLRQRRRDASAEVERLLQWMTQKDPELRPASYGEIREAIDAILGVTPTKRRAFAVSKASNGSRWLYGVAAVLVLVAIWRSVAPAIRGTSQVRDASDSRLVVAVTPFYGPDADSVKEGRVMAALVEKSIAARLGSDVRVVGIDQTKDPVRDHEQARKIGERFRAAVVVWGEAFALKNETELQPFFTLIQKKQRVIENKSEEDLREAVKGDEDPVAKLSERAAGVTCVGAEAPNQIELRKTSAEGVGEMVSFLAGLDALYNRDDPPAALKFFAQAPKSAEALRHTAQAHLREAQMSGRNWIPQEETAAKNQASFEQALRLLEEAVALEPSDMTTRVQLGDLYLQTDRLADAMNQYREVSRAETPYSSRNAIHYDNKLYVRETYRYEGQVLDSGYLIALDPITLNVVERHLLPGRVKSFSPSADGFTVEYEIDSEGSATETIAFSRGRFSAPVHLPVNMMLRMREMKSAWFLAENFMSDMSGLIEKQAPHPRFRPAQKDVIEDAPNTFEQLEPALRAAIARDPTQPWHRFHLGQLLDATGRKPEAEKVFEEMHTSD